MPLTPYTPNIPLAIQPINQTQQAINDNFQCLVNNITPANGLITVNHVGTNDPADYGKHKFVQFPVQAAAPATAANEVALYSKTVAAVPQLFLRRENNGAEINITSATASATGETTLPSGIRIKWGITTVARNALSVAIAFPGTNFANIFMMQATQTFSAGPNTGDLNTAVCVGDLTVANFKLFPRAIGLPGSGNIQVYWFAIGN